MSAKDKDEKSEQEHSEVIRKEAHNTRPGTGDARTTDPGVGPSLTLVDKSLRPSLLRWRSWQVSESFRNYAERAARGEKLPRFEGSILAKSRPTLPHAEAPATERYTARSSGKPPALLDPNSLVWNTWVWGSLALAFAVSLFAVSLWLTAPSHTVSWGDGGQAAPTQPVLSTRVSRVRATRAPKPEPAPAQLAAPVEPKPEPIAPAPPAAPAPHVAAPPAIAAQQHRAVSPGVPPPAPRGPVVSAAPARAPSAPLASAQPATARSVQEVRGMLDRLEGSVEPANAARTVSAPAATNKRMEAPASPAPAPPAAPASPPTPSASSAPASPAPPAPPAARATKRDPLLVEAPSF